MLSKHPVFSTLSKHPVLSMLELPMFELTMVMPVVTPMIGPM